ncbi:MAG: hypothetical protein M3Q07_18100 [Pseudobdellovibrionaceae bacterium]|nr:hypothetical protein [Pseudobdellovibrionaceae bacterium]
MDTFGAFYGIIIFIYVITDHSRAVQVQMIDVRIERLKLDLQSCMDASDEKGVMAKREDIRFALAVKEKITGWSNIDRIESEIRNRTV